jgi:hypothetical protein
MLVYGAMVSLVLLGLAPACAVERLVYALLNGPIAVSRDKSSLVSVSQWVSVSMYELLL